MNKEDIFALIVRHTRDVVPKLQQHAFSGSDELRSLGADSVDRAEIVTLVLEELSLDISRREALGPQSIDGLTDFLYAKLQAA